MTSLKTSIKTITYLSDIGCLEIQGASLESNGLTHERAEEIWNMFEKSGAYAFNKSHSVAYSLISYQSMWGFVE